MSSALKREHLPTPIQKIPRYNYVHQRSRWHNFQDISECSRFCLLLSEVNYIEQTTKLRSRRLVRHVAAMVMRHRRHSNPRPRSRPQQCPTYQRPPPPPPLPQPLLPLPPTSSAAISGIGLSRPDVAPTPRRNTADSHPTTKRTSRRPAGIRTGFLPR